MNSVKYLFYMELLNYLSCDMFGGILECYELTHVLPNPDHKTDMHEWAGIVTPLVGAYVVAVQLLTFLKLHFIMEWLL